MMLLARKLLLLSVMLCVSPIAAAQYYIGSDYYLCPAGLPWNDPRCVRQPVVRQQERQKERRTTWGAVAMDVETGGLGTAVGYLTGEEAGAAADLSCSSKGSGKCSRLILFHNQCAAVAFPTGDQGQVASVSGPELASASSRAKANCEKFAEEYKVRYQACSEPVMY